jgi:hypothetical protein
MARYETTTDQIALSVLSLLYDPAWSSSSPPTLRPWHPPLRRGPLARLRLVTVLPALLRAVRGLKEPRVTW